MVAQRKWQRAPCFLFKIHCDFVFPSVPQRDCENEINVSKWSERTWKLGFLAIGLMYKWGKLLGIKHPHTWIVATYFANIDFCAVGAENIGQENGYYCKHVWKS